MDVTRMPPCMLCIVETLNEARMSAPLATLFASREHRASEALDDARQFAFSRTFS
ncbi:hypothetical protein BRPE64_BCDS00430 [Caballeronia insecticola]|uniref:Uncharacterized protein n=1 Tax=Caballeronia insecticola TaxID=758793 RepID=R4WJU6_9BURK|nr:hypothetical protein BRPE64_BCDS00430 [Caballeronia insecticola]